MSKLRFLFSVLTGVVVVAAMSFPSHVDALELVPGGYGAAPATAAPVDDGHIDVGGATEAPSMALEFTPRGSTGLWSNPKDAAAGSSGLRFDLTVSGHPGALGGLGVGAASDGVRDPGRGAAPSALTVGGAMRWSDWSVGGGLGRARVLGEDVDVMSASLGYGRISAALSYGQSDTGQGQPNDVLMLSTDLAAWSWLTLESDLAVGSRQSAVDGERARSRESVAAGRFGLRLNF